MERQFEQAVEAFRNGDLERARSLAEADLSAASSPGTHHLLGLIHCRLGNPASGAEHLRVAADAEPGNAGFRIMLMRALVDAGRPAEVLAMPKPPAIRSAAALEQWRAWGEAADAARDAAAAIAAWSNVTAGAPADWRAWANLAAALVTSGRSAEAIDAFEKAVGLNPTEAALRWSLGAALLESGRPEQALGMLDDFEARVGRTGDSALARGRAALAALRIEEAEQAYRDAVNLAPQNADAVREFGLLLERTNRLGELTELLAEAIESGIPEQKLSHLYVMLAFRERRVEEAYDLLLRIDREEDPLGWNRVMAKLADRLGKASEAFAAAEAANRMTPQFDLWRERGAAYRREMRELSRSLTQAKALPRLQPPNRRMPAFLVGFPRSGTTLLDTFLMGHPETVVLEEEHMLGAAEREIGKAAKLARASRSSLERARTAYFAELDRHIADGFTGLAIDKLPLNLLGGPFIDAMFPGAPIIFAQRHPCDSVLSAFMQSFAMNDAMASFLTIEDAADLYDAIMSGWFAIRERFPLNVHTVRYERLVEDPEPELRPVVEFLRLEWSDQVLAHTRTAKDRGTIITPSYDQVTEPLTMRSVGRWKRYRAQLEPVLPVLRPWAERLGYRD
jgi:tetratricopeptide (TPR) repeat protein